jgi:hypothetical protein
MASGPVGLREQSLGLHTLFLPPVHVFAATTAPFLRTTTGLSTLLLTVNGTGDRMIMPYYF